MKNIGLIITFVITIIAISSCAAVPYSEVVSEERMSSNEFSSDDGTKLQNSEIDQSELSEECIQLFEVNENACNMDNSINLKNGFLAGKACYVSETDTLFYSDSSGLYMRSGDTIAMLTKMDAMSITVKNGRVYFINAVASNTSGMRPQGKVYYIDLKTRKCTELIDEEISSLSLSNEKLIYTKLVKADEGTNRYWMYSYSCDLDGKKHEKTEQKYLISNEKSCAGYDFGNGVRVYSLANNEEQFFVEDQKTTSLISLFGDELLFFGGDGKEFGVLKRINIYDQSCKEYFFPNDYVKDYAFFGGKFCYCDYGGNFIVEDENGVATSYVYPSFTNNVIIEALYSGGEYVYGLRSDGRISRLGFVKDSVQNVVTEEILSYEQN